MKLNTKILLLGLFLSVNIAFAQKNYQLISPDKSIELMIKVSDRVYYEVKLNGNPVVAPTAVGMTIDGQTIGNRPRVTNVSEDVHTGTLMPVVRQKSKEIQDSYNEQKLQFDGNYALTFRVYNGGVAYRFSTSFDKKEVIVNSEDFKLNLVENDTLYYGEEEKLFSHNERVHKKYAISDVSEKQMASLPVLASLPNGVKLVFSEADVQDYPGLWVKGTSGNSLQGFSPMYMLEEKQINNYDLVIQKSAEFIAKTAGKRDYPWRVTMLAKNDGELLTNTLIAQLAEPNRLKDVSWIKPGKVAWDWWNANNIYGVDFRAGINNLTYKYYIDFASKNGIEYVVLDEGWSKNDDLLSLMPEINVAELCAYAREKKVGIILWALNGVLERQMDTALDQFEKWGVKGIKVDFMQRDDQKTINFYWKTAEAAAKRRLLVDFHGAHKPDGLYITYPNVITSEGVYGLENSKWELKKQIGPEHNCTIPFIRQVAGPMDYTPGAMINGIQKDWNFVWDCPTSLGTRCHQLGMYLAYESPLQMLADSPTHYNKEPECMEFLSKVPSVWDKTIVLDAKLSDYVINARQAANGDWYIGGIGDW
ncbi:MAG: hypothetical protein RLZZ292_2724, partial [Bacteroidota bacterium]